VSEQINYSGAQALVAHQAFTAWGKLSRGKAGQLSGEHPLLDHMTDVAACFLALAECTSVRRSLEKTAGRALDAADLQRLQDAKLRFPRVSGDRPTLTAAVLPILQVPPRERG
jgi:hypothetical protein